jgi:RNA polymerase sigma factor (TIGR02999 family)
MSVKTTATRLLVEGTQGHKAAMDQLMPLVHDELRQIAHRLLQKRPAGGVLDTTGLVHEAYIKLIDQSQVEWTDRAHFEALCARAMRQILVDMFRRQQADKRGGKQMDVSLKKGEVPVGDRGDVLLGLDEALAHLTEKDERLGQVVQYRFFGGMSNRAIASVLDVSPRTVRRDWRKAKAWLGRELGGHGTVS